MGGAEITKHLDLVVKYPITPTTLFRVFFTLCVLPASQTLKFSENDTATFYAPHACYSLTRIESAVYLLIQTFCFCLLNIISSKLCKDLSFVHAMLIKF
jgi:hypothetical protein